MIALSSVKKSVYVAVASVASIATLIGILPATANAETYKAPITNVKDGVAANDSARVPAVESTIGRGSITVGKEGAVTLPGIGDAAAVLVRISVFSAKSDADITVSGSPALHAAAGQDVSATVLAKVKDGKINVGSSAAIDARIEVLATFASDAKVPGSTVALDAPVTRADTAKKIGADSLGTSPIQLGVVGLGGVPSSDVRAVYTTATIDATQSGTVTFAGQQFVVNAGRTVVSTIVTPDENGNIAISADKNLGALRVDVRGYVAGAAQNQQYANVQGGYVPVTGTDWQSADATQGTDASVKLPNVDGSLFALALVNAEANGKRSFVDVGKSINGRSSGVVVDKSAGAAAQLEVVEQAGVTSPVSVRGGKVKTNVLLLGDVLGEKPSIRGTVNVSIDSPSENADIDFAKTAGVTLEGKVSADSAVRSVDIYGNGTKIGTAAVRYTADGGSWRFDGAAPNSGFVSYEAKAIARDGATATAKRTVKVTIPDANATIIDPKVKVIDAANSPVTAVDDKGLTLNRAPDFAVGNIIVSDVSAGAPQGFLRWVDSIQQDGDTWRVTTHQATLTETIVQGKTSGDTPSTATVSDTKSEVTDSDSDSADNMLSLFSQPVSSVGVDSNERAIAPRQGSDSSAFALRKASQQNLLQKASASDSDDWVEQDPRDHVISTPNFPFNAEIPLEGVGKNNGKKTSIKAADQNNDPSVELGGTVTLGVTARIDYLFGAEVIPQWTWRIDRVLTYLKFEGRQSADVKAGIDAKASIEKLEKEIPLKKFNPKSTVFVGPVPIVISTEIELKMPISLELTGKISIEQSFHFEFQNGIRHDSSNASLPFLDHYMHGRTADSSDDADNEDSATVCQSTGISSSVSAEFSIEIAASVVPKAYGVLGGGIELGPKFTAEISNTIKDSGQIILDYELKVGVAAKLLMEFTVPILDKGLKFDSPELTLMIPILDKHEPLDSTVTQSCKPDTGSNPGHPGGNPAPLPTKTITWVDTRSGATNTLEYDQGTVIEISPVILAYQLGVKADDLKGLTYISSDKAGKNNIKEVGRTITIEQTGTWYLQYGKKPEDPKPEPQTRPAFRDVKSIHAADGGIAVKSDGTLWKWPHSKWDGGENYLPAQVKGVDHVVQVAGKHNKNDVGLTVLKDDGTVVKVYGDSDDPFVVQPIQNLPAIKSISDDMAIAQDGSVWAWQDNGPDYTIIAGKVPGLSNIKTLGRWQNAPLALLNDGTLWTWDGTRDLDQSDQPSVTYHPSAPKQIDLGIQPMQIFTSSGNVGESLSAIYASDQSGTLWRCEDYRVTGCTVVDGVTNVTQMVGGQRGVSRDLTATALTEDGHVYRWDESDSNGYLKDVSPQAIEGVQDVVSIDVGTINDRMETGDDIMETGYALSRDGSVYTWGDDNRGQRGNGKDDPNQTIGRYTATKVIGLKPVTQISAGNGYAFALSSDGTVWGWGVNDSGSLSDSRGLLGDGTVEDRDAPVLVGGLEIIPSQDKKE